MRGSSSSIGGGGGGPLLSPPNAGFMQPAYGVVKLKADHQYRRKSNIGTTTPGEGLLGQSSNSVGAQDRYGGDLFHTGVL